MITCSYKQENKKKTIHSPCLKNIHAMSKILVLNSNTLMFTKWNRQHSIHDMQILALSIADLMRPYKNKKSAFNY